MTKEERRVYNAAYYAAHKEEFRAYNADYYSEHREKLLVNNAAYYVSHPEYRSTYRAEHGDALREKDNRDQAEFSARLQVLRTNSGCEDCNTHEGRLLHHHIDPATKRCNVSKMYRRSPEMLEDELEKCVVLCSPCHEKRHVEMRALVA